MEEGETQKKNIWKERYGKIAVRAFVIVLVIKVINIVGLIFFPEVLLLLYSPALLVSGILWIIALVLIIKSFFRNRKTHEHSNKLNLISLILLLIPFENFIVDIIRYY